MRTWVQEAIEACGCGRGCMRPAGDGLHHHASACPAGAPAHARASSPHLMRVPSRHHKCRDHGHDVGRAGSAMRRCWWRPALGAAAPGLHGHPPAPGLCDSTRPLLSPATTAPPTCTQVAPYIMTVPQILGYLANHAQRSYLGAKGLAPYQPDFTQTIDKFLIHAGAADVAADGCCCCGGGAWWCLWGALRSDWGSPPLPQTRQACAGGGQPAAGIAGQPAAGESYLPPSPPPCLGRRCPCRWCQDPGWHWAGAAAGRVAPGALAGGAARLWQRVQQHHLVHLRLL